MPTTSAPRRQYGQRRADPAVVVSFRCPRCGASDHPAIECTSQEALRGLDLRGLRRLRHRVEREVVAHARHGESFADLEEVLAAIESRIARHDGEMTPTLQRRQQIAAERRSYNGA